ncbi:hypothetical protein QTH90_11925 [Variovorax sp. J2P1-59]|uniref:hypothetical protein n=1 Tax=Variovorax flavidus TaxID=3053501 RepID=UPI002575F189|nr:hypothetical protein [Variovorax sp. J2P1-59]MDM0075095.1 hypothetical protein [Variovorax sp. J2P1-59]
MKFMRVAWAALLILGAAGCAVTPQTKQSLSNYTLAMTQVEQSADMFLTDFSNGLKVQAELSRLGGAAPPPKPDFPQTLQLPDDGSTPPSPAEERIQQTRQALAVVHAYNQALVALAEGRPEGEIREGLLGLGAELQTLASVAGVAFPPFAPFVGIGAEIIQLAQDAANRKQFEQAVLKGRDPVHEILKTLAQQAPAMYRLSVVGTQQAQDRIRDETRRTASAMKGLVARSGPPTDPAVISSVAADQAVLSAIGRKTNTLAAMPVPYPYLAGKPPYDAATDRQTQIFIRSIAVSAQKNDELIAKQNAYHAMLVKYVELLKRTGEALDELARSLSAPVDLHAEISQLLRTAFALRDAMNEYRHPAATS